MRTLEELINKEKGLFYIDDGAFDANSIHRFEYCNFNFTGIYLTYINLPGAATVLVKAFASAPG